MPDMDLWPPLIWLDMEMTGLEPDTDHVLEIATLVTNADLEILAEGPDIVVHQSDEILDGMGEWCREQHGRTGLTDQSRRSTISLAEAEAQTLAFLQRFCEPGKSPLCGNSIGQDRRFIYRHLPALAQFLHYRSIDVSTIKELARRWYPLIPAIPKGESHRALDDVRDSLAELRLYRASVFRP
jgi:oligoribonuclease